MSLTSVGIYEFNAKDLIGHGAFAVVYKGRLKSVSEPFLLDPVKAFIVPFSPVLVLFYFIRFGSDLRYEISTRGHCIYSLFLSDIWQLGTIFMN